MKQSTYPFALMVLGLFLGSCTPNESEGDVAINREIVRSYHQIWSDGNVAALDSILAPDFVNHFLGGVDDKGSRLGKNLSTATEPLSPTGRKKSWT